METKGRIGIPRALLFYRYFPLWKAFFESLGWEVLVSGGAGGKREIVSFEDSCLPMKLLVTHALDLSGRADHLFVPRLVSLHRGQILCPKFRGAPEILRLALKQNESVLDETFDFRMRGQTHQEAFRRIGKRLGASAGESHSSLQKAERIFDLFQRDWEDRINRVPTRDLFRVDLPTPGPRGDGVTSHLSVALIGHPYNLYDAEINKDVLGLARSLGMRIVPSGRLTEGMVERQLSGLSKEIYWSAGREIVGSLFYFLSGGVDGVVWATSFKCGIDALLQEFVKRVLRIRKKPTVPFLILSFDEHTGREGLRTRLEAFRDVIEERKRQIQTNASPTVDEPQSSRSEGECV